MYTASVPLWFCVCLVYTYLDTKYICAHLFHFIEGCHLNLGNVSQVGCFGMVRSMLSVSMRYLE